MSFDWNLSDDEDDGDFDFAKWNQKVKDDDDDEDDGDYVEKTEESAFGVTKSSPASTIPPFASLNHPCDPNKGDDDDDDAEQDEDSVDWEDASNASDDQKPKASKEKPILRALHIDLNQAADETTTKVSSSSPAKRPRRVSQFRIETLSPRLQSLIRNIHRSHLLTITSRAIHRSHICIYPTILAVAHSLIPEEWNLTTQSIRELGDSASSVPQTECPSIATLHSFMTWYIDFVHGVRGRRETQRRLNIAAGAPIQRRARAQKRKGDSLSARVDASGPRFVSTGDQLLSLASYLSVTHDRDPQLLLEHRVNTTKPTNRLYNELLLAMARSMGWRARFVQSIEPVALDLTVDHPLLAVSSSYGKLFSEVWKSVKPFKRRNTTKAIVKATHVSTTNTQRHQDYSFPTQPESKILDWLEILCVDPQANSRQRWIHVDATHKLVDRPDQVELLLGNGVYKNDNGGSKSSSRKRDVVAYVVGAEHYPSCRLVGSFVDESSGGNSTATIGLRLTDVTPRYSASWVDSLRKRGIVRSKKCSIAEKVRKSWWTKTLHQVNEGTSKQMHILKTKTGGMTSNDAILLDDIDENTSHPVTGHIEDSTAEHETKELQSLADSEAIPTSKAAFATHPKFVIPSVLGKTEVLAPDAGERVCGVFKGQLVFRREDVSSALTAKKWLYEGRKVLDEQMTLPVKRRKVRKKPAANGGAFKALRSYGVGESNDGDEQRQIQQGSIPLEDGMEDLYAVWQTNSWSPIPVGPHDKIPMNEFKNIELALLNPGLVHIDQTGLAAVAKKLAIPYAPCLLGFENGTGGNRTPLVRGIVVHQHNEQLVREAGVEVSHYAVEKEYQDRRQTLLLHWKRLMVGLLTKERLDREYGSNDSHDE